MALLRRLPVSLVVRRVAAPRLLRGSIRAMSGHDHHDTTLEPPMHSLPLPDRPLHEQDEIIWNDGVAPETALDFDAPHIPAMQGLLMWLGGFAFFYSIWLVAGASDHPSNKPSGPRDLPESTKTTALGGAVKF